MACGNRVGHSDRHVVIMKEGNMVRFNRSKTSRVFVAHGGGMLALCADVGLLWALRAYGIDLSTFWFVCCSAGHFVPSLLTRHSLETVAGITVNRSFRDIFPHMHDAATIVGKCLVRWSRAACRRHALGEAMYASTGLGDFWQTHLDGFPPKVCIIASTDEGEMISFSQDSCYYYPHKGDSVLLGEMPAGIALPSRGTVAIPGVVQALPCPDVIVPILGNKALDAIPHARERWILDGGLVRDPLALLARHYPIDREATIACAPDGPGASYARLKYYIYTRLVRGMPRLRLRELVDAEVGMLVDIRISELGQIEFNAPWWKKLSATLTALAQGWSRCAQFLEVPSGVTLQEEMVRMLQAVNRPPPPGFGWLVDATKMKPRWC